LTIDYICIWLQSHTSVYNHHLHQSHTRYLHHSPLTGAPAAMVAKQEPIVSTLSERRNVHGCGAGIEALGSDIVDNLALDMEFLDCFCRHRPPRLGRREFPPDKLIHILALQYLLSHAKPVATRAWLAICSAVTNLSLNCRTLQFRHRGSRRYSAVGRETHFSKITPSTSSISAASPRPVIRARLLAA
jgi:hypothetical protein